VVVFFIVRWIIRILYEVWSAKNLVYVEVTLPRKDSKLDKEKETKKDFKEKIGVMSVVYKAVHKMAETSLKLTILDFFFNHIKVSFEIAHRQGQIYFYVVTYRNLFSFLSRQISSVYPDAELSLIQKKDYVNMKKDGYVMRSSTVSKTYDKFFPIKTYKYFEEDPLSNLSSNFESFSREDTAVMQFVIKPIGEGWNKKAKDVARKFSKGEYKRKGGRGIDIGIFHALIAPISWFVSRFVSNEYS